MRGGLRTALWICAGLSIAPALLAEPTAADRAIAGHMQDWFDGERNEAYVFLGAGVASLGGGVYLATRDDDMAQGAGYTIGVMGGLLTAFSISYLFSLSPKHDELKQQLARDPAGYKRDETERMDSIADRFVLYRWAEIAVLATGAGLITYGLIDDKDAVTGVGIGLAGEAALLLTLDYFAERRAHTYIDHLHEYQPGAASAAPLRLGSSFVLGYSGDF